MRILYMGSPAPAVSPLAYLLDKEVHRFHVVGVVSQPAKPAGRGRGLIQPPVAQFAMERGLLVLQPTKASDPDFLRQLEALQVDVIITCAYGQILSSAFLAIPKRATINIHPSALPQYRGATPVPAALLAGDTETAVTVLFTVKQLDAGALIVQQSFPIQEMETAGALTHRLFASSGPLLSTALEKLLDPSFVGLPQDESQVSLCQKMTKEQGCVDWQAPAALLLQRYRAFSPWPGTYTYFRGKRVALEQLLPVDSAIASVEPAGTFSYVKASRKLQVRCGDGKDLLIAQLKPEGGSSISAESFWNGLRDKTSPLLFTSKETL